MEIVDDQPAKPIDPMDMAASRSNNCPVQEPIVTVVFPLYRTAATIPGLVDSVLSQKHPEYSDQAKWLRVYFVDDCSPDATLRVLENALLALGNPPHIKIIRNKKNLGLSKSLNTALASVTTEFVVTCHNDCRFATDDYVFRLIEIMRQTSDAAAVTGQPIADSPMNLEQKINLIANVQDIFPRDDVMNSLQNQLVYVGFAEGRCDGFRMNAMREAGLYDTSLRLAGEDQILAGRLRELGYGVYQARNLYYYLSVSAQQDSIRRLMLHQHLFGKTHPYILLRARETVDGVIGKRAGPNRRLRVALRISQLISVALYLVICATKGRSKLRLGAILLLAMIKTAIFQRHLRHIGLKWNEFVLFTAIQPGLDFSYSIGLVEGLFYLVSDNAGKSL